MNTISLFSHLQKDISRSLVLDMVIVVGLVLVAWLAFYVTPEFAANLAQDGGDFAVPAVNLLERGRLVDSAYGHEFPPLHPPGMPLLLVPAYMLFGHAFGNGIYPILGCALVTIVLTYAIGRRLGGRLCGAFAALFLITHYGFWQYSQKIMSEVPSTLLGIAVLALLLPTREQKRPGFVCFTAGCLLGLAVTLRPDNVLLLGPAVLLLAWEGAWRKRLWRVGLCLAGLAPFIVGLAVYDQVTFGSPWRTGYRYWGGGMDDKLPSFSVENVTLAGVMWRHGITKPMGGILEGNGVFYAKSLLSETDTSRIFGHPLYWQLPGRSLYQTLVLLRTALGVIGLLACLAAWRTNSLRRHFLLWLVGTAAVYVGFFLLFWWQEERYIMRVAPAYCLANAIGVTTLFNTWSAKGVRTLVAILVGILIIAFAFFNWQMGFPSGNDLHAYDTLTQAARQIESNAVVVSNFEPVRVDAYLIRGTHRIAVPLSPELGLAMYVGGDTTPTWLRPFVASEDPEQLRELIQSGKPVYWLIDDPWSGRSSPALYTLEQSFRLQVLATANVNGRGEQPYFGRIYNQP